MTPDPTPSSLFPSRGAAPVLPPPPIPDHELIRPIGRGAYGEVWIARSVTGAYRAVKIVRRSSFDHDRPFEREFEGILKFEPISRTHDSQVDILHVGRGDDYFYYVMELADDQASGGQINPDNYHPRTLKSDLLFRGRLPFEECVPVAVALTTALDHLHRNGLVHRDVKPSNIIFVNGVAKLADIGLVTGFDTTRSYVGTEGFAAPEGPGTPQADIYSLGKVLYEMSTGKDRQEFPELPTQLREMPDREGLAELNYIVAQACRFNPADRYKSVSEIKDEVLLLNSGKSVREKRSESRKARQFRRAALVVFVIVSLGASHDLLRTGGWETSLWNAATQWELLEKPEVEWHSVTNFGKWGTLIDPDSDCYVTGEPRRLTISIPPNVHDLSIDRLRMNAPRLLQAVDGDFTITVKVHDFTHQEEFGILGKTTTRFAGIVVLRDNYNYARLEIRQNLNGQTRFGSQGTYSQMWINGKPLEAKTMDANSGITLQDRSAKFLCFQRRDNLLSSFESFNGTNWNRLRDYQCNFPPQSYVGIFAGHTTATRMTATFEDFTLFRNGNTRRIGQ